MIVNSDLLASLALIALSMIGISLMWFNNPTARKASMFFAFPVILVMAFYMLSIPATSVGTPTIMNITSNTIYQNTNSTPLSIYITTQSAPLSGYLSNNNTNLPPTPFAFRMSSASLYASSSSLSVSYSPLIFWLSYSVN